MNAVTSALVLTMMVKAQPAAPWRNTYERTSEAIAAASNAAPLFSGDDGPTRTAAFVTSVAWFEGTFDPQAKGDGACIQRDASGKCTKKGPPQSFCTMQVHESNYASLGVTKEQILEDVDTCIRAGLRMMHISFGVCREWPLAGRLNQYATGGGTCVQPAHDEGGHRVRKGLWLFGLLKHPS